jgi:hypothetical protein
LSQPEASTRTSKDFLIYFLLALTVVAALLNVAYLWLQTSNPGETSAPESLFILHAQNLAEGKPLYTDFRKPPYNLTPYTPVYYGILAGIKIFFSLDVEQLFTRGRQLMICFSLILAALISWHSFRTTASKTISALSALVFLGAYLLWPAACTNRADLPAVLFSIVGLLIFMHDDKRGLYLSIPFFVLAFFTKQSFVIGFAAVFLYLLIDRKFRSAVLFLILSSLIMIVTWFGLHALTNGMSTLNIVGSNIAPMSFFNVRLVAVLALQSATLAFILSFAGLRDQFWKNLASIYFLLSLLWALFTAAKAGSSSNYFLEPLAAGCLLIPEALRKNLETKARSRALLATVFAIMILPQINFMVHSLKAIHFQYDEKARRFANQANGLVISDNPRISLATKHPFFLEPFPYSYLEKTQAWNPGELQSLIKQGKIEFFIMTNPFEHPLTWQRLTRIPSSVLQTASQEYKLAGRVDGYYVYVHK